jgi:hypothetical protein
MLVSVATIENEAAHHGTEPFVVKYAEVSVGLPPTLIPMMTVNARYKTIARKSR